MGLADTMYPEEKRFIDDEVAKTNPHPGRGLYEAIIIGILIQTQGSTLQNPKKNLYLTKEGMDLYLKRPQLRNLFSNSKALSLQENLDNLHAVDDMVPNAHYVMGTNYAVLRYNI